MTANPPAPVELAETAAVAPATAGLGAVGEAQPDALGVIYGTVGTTTFQFAVTAGRTVHRNDFIQVIHPDCGPVLGKLEDLARVTDLSFDQAQKISGGEKIAIGERVTGTVHLIGYRDERGAIQVPREPFAAGVIVHRAESALIRRVIGLKENDAAGAYIGMLKGFDIRVSLDINRLVQRHMSILAQTGSGKSFLAGVFIEELIKRRVPVLVFDPHGEYSSLMHPNTSDRDKEAFVRFGISPKRYADQIVEYSPDTSINRHALPLKFDEINLEVDDLMDLTGLKASGAQRGILNRAVRLVAAANETYGLHEVLKEVKNDKNNAKWAVVNALEYVESLGMFGLPPTRLSDLVKEGQCTIINLRGVAPDLQDLVAARIAKKVFHARKVDRVPPLILMLEESHTFCPQSGVTMSLPVLRTVAAEGRKFGLGLCVVSQRPAKIDKNVLSQCGTQLILKVTNPNDLKAIAQSIEGLTPGMEETIQRLPIGSCLVSGAGLSTPIIVDVRVRETKHGGESISVVSPAAALLAREREMAAGADGAPGEHVVPIGGAGPTSPDYDTSGPDTDHRDVAEDGDEPEEEEGEAAEEGSEEAGEAQQAEAPDEGDPADGDSGDGAVDDDDDETDVAEVEEDEGGDDGENSDGDKGEREEDGDDGSGESDGRGA